MTDLRRPGSRLRRVALALTEVFSPLVVSLSVLLVVALMSAPTARSGLGWWLLASVFVGVVPYGFLLLGVRRGRWTGRHVPLREQRSVPLLFAAASVVVGVVVLAAVGAPRQLIALVVAGLAGLGVSFAVSLRWKMSIHTGVASGAAVVLFLVAGAVTLPAWLAVFAVAWARVELRDHSVGQVIAGAIIGGVVAATVFSTLR